MREGRRRKRERRKGSKRRRKGEMKMRTKIRKKQISYHAIGILTGVQRLNPATEGGKRTCNSHSLQCK